MGLGVSSSGWLWLLLLLVALIGTLSSTVFLGMVFAAVARYTRLSNAARHEAATTSKDLLPPVTLLKPVHGMEPRLAENIESFFQQDYPNFEIVFGARDASNAALQVAEEMRRRYPNVKSKTVISGFPSWPNAKVFSLDKMIAESSFDHLIITDSDIKVAPDFIRNLIPPLLVPENGLATCFYRGVPAPGLWSTLEALGMSVEMPSGVMVADMMEGMRFAMGAVMATRRDVLEKIGGISSTRDYYSDDFVLGHEIWKAGYRVLLSHHFVEHVLMPRSFRETFGDQLRWMKSTRYSRPKGHIGTGLTFAMPFGILGFIAAAALGHPLVGAVLLAWAFLNRMAQCLTVGWGVLRDRRALGLCWLYPLRDLLGFCTWGGSFVSRTFFWRGETYQFSDGGKIIPQHRPATDPADPS
ncbi:MAG TPA: glycosyltransferase [Terriglobales bacterium]|jgi:ceramide glucosyltransferase|nr:glycosyltransferase [Terriglobales bacterium]